MAPQIPIWAGILVGVLSSLIQSLGLTIQRKSHILNESLPISEQKPDYKRPLWLLGFGIFISTNVLGSVFQIASLPVVILAPLGAISLLWNALFARLLLSDPFTLPMSLGTLLVTTGAVLVGIFGVLPSPTHSLDDLIALFARPPFLAFFIITLSATAGLLILTHAVEWRWKSRRRAAEQAAASRSSDPLEVTERTALLSTAPLSLPPATSSHLPPPIQLPPPAALQPHSDGPRLFLALSYALLSGSLSAYGLIFAKAGSELLLLTLSGENQFWRWQAWLILPGLAVFGLSQLWYLQRSLEFGGPTLICPLAFCTFNIFSILDSLIYYDQLSHLSPLQLSLILLGTTLLLGGVWLLSLQAGKDVHLGTGVEDAFSEDGQAFGAHTPPPAHERSFSFSFSEEPESFYSPTYAQQQHAHLRTPPRASHAQTHGQPEPPLSGESEPISPNRRRFLAFLSLSPETAPGSGSGSGTGTGSGMGMGTGYVPPVQGFSIGLAPTSPGFVISPPRRRGRAATVSSATATAAAATAIGTAAAGAEGGLGLRFGQGSGSGRPRLGREMTLPAEPTTGRERGARSLFSPELRARRLPRAPQLAQAPQTGEAGREGQEEGGKPADFPAGGGAETAQAAGLGEEGRGADDDDHDDNHDAGKDVAEGEGEKKGWWGRFWGRRR